MLALVYKTLFSPYNVDVQLFKWINFHADAQIGQKNYLGFLCCPEKLIDEIFMTCSIYVYIGLYMSIQWRNQSERATWSTDQQAARGT